MIELIAAIAIAQTPVVETQTPVVAEVRCKLTEKKVVDADGSVRCVDPNDVGGIYPSSNPSWGDIYLVAEKATPPAGPAPDGDAGGGW